MSPKEHKQLFKFSRLFGKKIRVKKMKKDTKSPHIDPVDARHYRVLKKKHVCEIVEYCSWQLLQFLIRIVLKLGGGSHTRSEKFSHSLLFILSVSLQPGMRKSNFWITMIKKKYNNNKNVLHVCATFRLKSTDHVFPFSYPHCVS